MVNINKVINVDFNITKISSPIGSYKTVVYIVGTAFTSSDTLRVGTKAYNYKLCKSYQDVLDCGFTNSGSAPVSYADNVRCSAYNFFANGGAQLLIIQSSLLTGSDTFAADFIKAIAAFQGVMAEDERFLYVCIAHDVETKYGKNNVKTILKLAEETKSPYTFRVLLTFDASSSKTIDSYISDYDLKNYSVGVKYCSKTLTGGGVIDAALLIGAYYSNVNLDGSETIKDYCYTPEKLINNISSDPSVFNDGIENVSSDEYDKLINANINFIDMIGQYIVNFGGNLANGVNIHTDFGTCAAENDVTYAVLDCMLTKPYLTAEGLNKVISVINSALIRYKTNGYLELGSVYSGETVVRKYNGMSFILIKKGTSISQGYYVTAIPIANISDTDREDRRFTPIYVILQTAFGARVVEIDGEVR